MYGEMLCTPRVEDFVGFGDEGASIVATGTDEAGHSSSNNRLCMLSGVGCCKPSI
jgi:hypothetical protein